MGKHVLRREIRQLRRDLRRADLHDVEVQFRASRREVKLARQELQVELSKINRTEHEVASDQGRQAGGNAVWGYFVGATGVIVVAIDVILRLTVH